MNVINITPAELSSGNMNTGTLNRAVTAIRNDGYIVLNGVVDPTHLEALHSKMFEDAETILALPEPPFQFVYGHIQHDPPPFEPYLFPDIICNDLVIAVTRAILGKGVKNLGYTGNTNMPGSVRQPVHADQTHLWPNQAQAHPACALVVNVPVVDMTVHNGSIELWPGSHQDTTVGPEDKIRVPEEQVLARRQDFTPIQPRVPVGSVLIRDMRLWHRGMPNHSDRPRPMIAMIHTCSWLWDSKILLAKGSETYFEHELLHTAARYVEKEEINYLTRHGSYDVREEERDAGSPF